uniref:SH3KBP1 binding protein 1 n=1 Tax=Homo sapiens TaxID=9606 RepID=M0QX42_HUMAN
MRPEQSSSTGTLQSSPPSSTSCAPKSWIPAFSVHPHT